MISKELFVESLEAMRLQMDYDIKSWDLIQQAFNTNEFPLYNNMLLNNAIFSLLRQYFPKESNGFCEIEHYCFVLDFGKCGEDYESAEELYDRMLENKKQWKK